MTKKFKCYYDTIGVGATTCHIAESATDKSQAESTDIYKCIEKYGIDALARKTMAEEYMFLDNTDPWINMDMKTAINQKKQMKDYFEKLPARARKVFGDNLEVFTEKYRNGDFNDFAKTGVLNQEQIENLKEAYNAQKEMVQNNTELHTEPANSVQNS